MVGSLDYLLNYQIYLQDIKLEKEVSNVHDL